MQVRNYEKEQSLALAQQLWPWYTRALELQLQVGHCTRSSAPPCPSHLQWDGAGAARGGLQHSTTAPPAPAPSPCAVWQADQVTDCAVPPGPARQPPPAAGSGVGPRCCVLPHSPHCSRRLRPGRMCNGMLQGQRWAGCYTAPAVRQPPPPAPAPMVAGLQAKRLSLPCPPAQLCREGLAGGAAPCGAANGEAHLGFLFQQAVLVLCAGGAFVAQTIPGIAGALACRGGGGGAQASSTAVPTTRARQACLQELKALEEQLGAMERKHHVERRWMEGNRL